MAFGLLAVGTFPNALFTQSRSYLTNILQILLALEFDRFIACMYINKYEHIHHILIDLES